LQIARLEARQLGIGAAITRLRGVRGHRAALGGLPAQAPEALPIPIEFERLALGQHRVYSPNPRRPDQVDGVVALEPTPSQALEGLGDLRRVVSLQLSLDNGMDGDVKVRVLPFNLRSR